MVTRVGFIGLGIMGKPMALNLIKAGFPLTIYNRTAGRGEELVQAGAEEARSPDVVAAASDVIITIVSNSEAVESVLLDQDGVIDGIRPGSVVIDMSTISPAVTRKAAAALKSLDVEMLDAPVSGGPMGATAGTLSIMVGGSAEVLERCMPILQAMGKKITHMGPIGMGQTTKLCNQIINMGTAAAVAEGLRFARAAGLNQEQIVEVAGSGAAASFQLANAGKLIAAEDWRAGFRAMLAHKDLRLALDEAQQMGLTLPGTDLVTGLLQTLIDAGAGDLGYQAIAANHDDKRVYP